MCYAIADPRTQMGETAAEAYLISSSYCSTVQALGEPAPDMTELTDRLSMEEGTEAAGMDFIFRPPIAGDAPFFSLNGKDLPYDIIAESAYILSLRLRFLASIQKNEGLSRSLGLSSKAAELSAKYFEGVPKEEGSPYEMNNPCSGDDFRLDAPAWANIIRKAEDPLARLRARIRKNYAEDDWHLVGLLVAADALVFLFCLAGGKVRFDVYLRFLGIMALVPWPYVGAYSDEIRAAADALKFDAFVLDA